MAFLEDDSGPRLCYDERGSGPTILLVMGIGAQMVHWDEGLCEQLAEPGFRVVRFDNRDVGLSEDMDHLGVPPLGSTLLRGLAGARVPAPYTLSDMGRDALRLLDHLGVERAHVVGASMGGMIAQHLAIEHPERLLSMTSLMSTTGAKLVSVGRPGALRALLKGPPPSTPDEAAERALELHHALGGSAFPPDPERVLPRARRIFERAPSRPRGFLRQLAAILASGDRTEALRSVRVPTLVLHGSEDPLLPPAGGRATAEAIPGARLHLIEGMGHTLPPGAWPELAAEVHAHAGAQASEVAPRAKTG